MNGDCARATVDLSTCTLACPDFTKVPLRGLSCELLVCSLLVVIGVLRYLNNNGDVDGWESVCMSSLVA